MKRPYHYVVRKVGKAVRHGFPYLKKIYVSFEFGTAGRSDAPKRWLTPKVLNDHEVTVRCFGGLWKVKAECFQFAQEDGRRLRNTKGGTYKARLSFDAGELIRWIK